MRQLLLYILIISATVSYSQSNTYILNGSAQQNSCNCYTLTEDVVWQGGSVWNSRKINLNQSFDFWFNVYLGCKDDTGADGIVFMLQPLSTSIGTSGEGMGFAGVTPSIGIALDTYFNPNQNDPAYDHISIQANGNPNHSADLVSPVQASVSSSNIEDCQWHTLRIKWNAVTKTIEVYFDGTLRLTTQIDLIVNIFNNNPEVYWGFSGATGGSSNLQRFCTALNARFTGPFVNDGGCLGQPIQFTDASESFAPIESYFWDFGDGSTSTLQNPQHTYQAIGTYQVKMVIKGLDGCISDTLKKNISIGTTPDASFNIYDTCYPYKPRISNSSPNFGTDEQWYINNTIAQDASSFNLSAGTYNIKREITSRFGCGTDNHEEILIIKPRAEIDAVFNDGCVEKNIGFSAIQTNNTTQVANWTWNINNQSFTGQAVNHTFNEVGNYPVKLIAEAINGCLSDTLRTTIFINKAEVDAGDDTLVIKNTPFMLKGFGNGDFLWTPSTGLNNTTFANPSGTVNDDQQYILTVTTDEGCIATDTVLVSVFKGSAIYVPNAFTPNGDGKNDLLKPLLIGINKLHYFKVFNRWGEMIFSTSKQNEGWAGKIKGKIAPSGTYVWIIYAEDIAGKKYQLKGTTTIIR